MTRNSIQPQDYIAGLGKGLAILECFDSERQRVSVTSAAEKTGISRAAARRYLLTLLHLGYLQEEGTYFYLTPKILKFSSAYFSTSPLAKIAQSLLNLLTLQTANSCSIVVFDEMEAITIVRSQSNVGMVGDLGLFTQKNNRITPYGVNIGHRLPAYATSAGKVLLAFLEECELKRLLNTYPLKRLTTNTITDKAVLQAQLAQIYEQQWCYAKEEHEFGIHAVAVPIFGGKGQVIAALNMVTPTQSCTADYLQSEGLSLLRTVAQELRNML